MDTASHRGVRRIILIGAAVLLTVAAGSCGLEHSYTGMGDGALPGDPNFTSDECVGHVICECVGGSPGEPPAEDCEESSLPSLAGATFRFTALEIGRPLPELFEEPVNEFLADDLDSLQTNILLLVETDERETHELEGVLITGEPGGAPHRVAGVPSPISMRLCGVRLETTAGAELAIPVGEGVLEPAELPLTDINLSGEIVDDGGGIISGELAAVLTGEAAAAIRAMGQPLGALLENLQSPPDLDLDGDGEYDSWRASGSFEAFRVEIAPLEESAAR